MHCLGETTADMGRLNQPAETDFDVRYGIYACSPLDSSFEARFSNFKLENSLWMAHSI